MSDSQPLVNVPAAPPSSPPRRRRSWTQRLLLVTGALLSVTALVVASVVAWGAWKYRQIDRTEVSLDELGGELAWVAAGPLGRGQGGVGAPVAVLSPARPLQHHPVRQRVDGEGVQRVADGGGEVFADHSGGPSRTWWVVHPTGGSPAVSQRDRCRIELGG